MRKLPKQIVIIIIAGCTLLSYTGIYVVAKLLLSPRDGTYLSNTLYYRAPDANNVDFIPDSTTMYVQGELLFMTDDQISKRDVEKIVRKEGGKVVGYAKKQNVYQSDFGDVDYDRLQEIKEKLEALSDVNRVMLNIVIDSKNHTSTTKDHAWADEAVNYEEQKGTYKTKLISGYEGFDANLIADKTGQSPETLKAGEIRSVMDYLIGLSYMITKDDGTTEVVDVDVSIDDLRYAASHGDKTAKELLDELNGMTGDVLKSIKEERDFVIVKDAGDDLAYYDVSKANVDAVAADEDVQALMDAYRNGGVIPYLSDEEYEQFKQDAEALLSKKQLTVQERKMVALYYLYEATRDQKPFIEQTDPAYDFISGITDQDLLPQIIVVGAMNGEGEYEKSVACGKRIDLVAPASSIYVTIDGQLSAEGYTSSDFASAYVASALALALSENASLTSEELRELLFNDICNKVNMDGAIFPLLDFSMVMAQVKGGTVPQNIAVSPKKLALYVTEQAQLSGTAGVHYASDNLAVARVDASGKVTAVGKGETMLYAYAGKQAIPISVTVKAPSLKLNLTELELVKGERATVKATVKGASHEVTWASEDETIATVDAGKITAVAPGSTTITASANGVVKRAQVRVISGRITLETHAVTVEKGKSKTVKATITGEEKTAVWTSHDTTIATVDAKGKITGVKEGTTTVDVEANGVKETIKVTVEDAVTKFQSLTPKNYGWKIVKKIGGYYNRVRCSWQSVKDADGYEYEWQPVYEHSGTHSDRKTTKATSFTYDMGDVDGDYHVDFSAMKLRVRAYRKVNGKTVYTKWSSWRKYRETIRNGRWVRVE